MSLFRKPKKSNIQRRVFTENEEDEGEPMDFQESRLPEKKSSKKDKGKKPKQTLLSFETEEEGEVFQVLILLIVYLSNARYQLSSIMSLKLDLKICIK